MADQSTAIAAWNHENLLRGAVELSLILADDVAFSTQLHRRLLAIPANPSATTATSGKRNDGSYNTVASSDTASSATLPALSSVIGASALVGVVAIFFAMQWGRSK